MPALVIATHAVPARAGERALLDGLQPDRPVDLHWSGPDFAPAAGGPARPLGDPFLRRPVRLESAPGGSVTVKPPGGVVAEGNGESLHGGRTFTREEIAQGVVLDVADRMALVLCLVEPAPSGDDRMEMVGDSPALRRLRREIAQAADLAGAVVVRGEPGSGKELAARAIHQRSARRKGPFVPVNLADAAPVELFGARRETFTASERDREGRLGAARGGTLFLRGVAEASPEAQALLLRVLEAGEYLPVGSGVPVRADVRLITATGASLEALVRSGQLKEALGRRIGGHQVEVPPLRARRADIGPLLFHFARLALEESREAYRLDGSAPGADPWMPSRLAARLLLHRWPGNVKELREVVRHLVAQNRGRPTIARESQVEGISNPITPRPKSPAREPELPRIATTPSPRRKPSSVTDEELRAALEAARWNLKAAADLLGISRSSIYDLIDQRPGFRTADDLSTEEITRCHTECQGKLDEMVRRLQVSERALRRRLRDLGLWSKGRRRRSTRRGDRGSTRQGGGRPAESPGKTGPAEQARSVQSSRAESEPPYGGERAMPHVDVLDDQFSPETQTGQTTQQVEFQNQRSTQVTVTLNVPPGLNNFFSTNQLILKAKGQLGDTKTATINGGADTKGYFEAPKIVGGKERDEDTIKGDIKVDPRK